jgi:N-succinyldiaminopimelate aminotransferase
MIRSLEQRLGRTTAAIYLSTPNNPTGRILSRERVDAIVDWAAGHDLWVVSDEVYEDYVFDGSHRHSRTAAPERTFSVHSFSKAYGMAGNRCGYVVGPRDGVAQMEKATTHSLYCAPKPSQLAALRVLGDPGDAWLLKTRGLYLESGRRAAERLGVAPPQGGTFLFLDVAAQLDHRGLFGFLDACVERGLLLAPGPAFGPYPTHVRLCFTCSEPEIVQRGVEVLAELLGR